MITRNLPPLLISSSFYHGKNFPYFPRLNATSFLCAVFVPAVVQCFQNAASASQVLPCWSLHGLAGHADPGPAPHSLAARQPAECADLLLLGGRHCLRHTAADAVCFGSGIQALEKARMRSVPSSGIVAKVAMETFSTLNFV